MKDWRAKIKTLEEVARAVGARPRRRNVALCAGVFDVVHPGHVRHLLYAKGKADILVAALTADCHIDKGTYRPHVPQDLRAMNLAAYEFIDYVIIDPEPTPVPSILALQPDFFAKGYEYVEQANPKTETESQAVESYGGVMLFTPGDVVYSSSRFLEVAPPNLRNEKLLACMERAAITFAGLRDTVETMRGRRVHVVGDTIVDSITRGAVIGSHGKTPTISVAYEGRDDYVGGAGIVAKHLAAAGAIVEFTTVLGDDPLGAFALQDLTAAGMTVNRCTETARPTTNKNVVVADGYRLLKIDTVDNRTITDSTLDRIADKVRRSSAHAVVFSDFRHGIFNRRTIPPLVAAIAAPFRVADSQVASRWGNIIDFKGFDLITPNEREARFSLGDQESGIRPLASALYKAAECRGLMLKMGDRGMLACSGADHEDLDAFVALDSFSRVIVDAVGAGDALLAYATLAMLSSGSVVMASIIGSIAAALECEVEGNVPITPERVVARLVDIEKEANYGSRD